MKCPITEKDEGVREELGNKWVVDGRDEESKCKWKRDEMAEGGEGARRARKPIA